MHFPELDVVIFENDREEHKLFKRILIELRQINQTQKEIKQIMSTIPPGLQALETADQSLVDAITALSQAIKDATDKLSNSVNAEDATVGSVAQTVNEQAAQLNALAKGLEDAVNPPAPPVDNPPVENPPSTEPTV